MFGSEFFIYDEGANTKKKKKSKKDTGSDERGELGMVIFVRHHDLAKPSHMESNILYEWHLKLIS